LLPLFDQEFCFVRCIRENAEKGFQFRHRLRNVRFRLRPPFIAVCGFSGTKAAISDDRFGSRVTRFFLKQCTKNVGKYTKLPQHYQMAVKYTK
jgi:hypothetical protein